MSELDQADASLDRIREMSLASMLELVRDAWCRALELESVRMMQDFSSLGGTPEKLIEIAYYLEEELGAELQLETLLMVKTVREMAFAIKAMACVQEVHSNHLSEDLAIKLQIHLSVMEDRVTPGSLLVRFNENGDKPPLFWCFNAISFESIAMVGQLPSDQPLYAMISSVSLGRSSETQEALVAHYVEEITKVYPEGPLYLGGNCRGARVMADIFRQFKNSGRVAEKVCLQESFNEEFFNYQGDLMLVFGKWSKLKRHELINWGKRGWQKQFLKVPKVHFIPCGHNRFFEPDTVKHLGKHLREFLSPSCATPSPFRNFARKLMAWRS